MEHRGREREHQPEREPDSGGSGLDLTAGNATTVCLQAVTEAQAALLAAPTPHGEYTSLTDGGSDVTGPHNRPASASVRQVEGRKEREYTPSKDFYFKIF